MNFNTGRLARLAGLLTEGAEKEEEDAVSEAEEVDEADKVDEADEADEGEDCDEGAEIKEAYDVRRIVRDEIQKSLARRDPNVAEYTSGQVFGKKNRQPTLGEVVFGFPGIGFKR